MQMKGRGANHRRRIRPCDDEPSTGPDAQPDGEEQRSAACDGVALCGGRHEVKCHAAPHPLIDLIEDRRMTRFAVIEAKAAKRKGGPQALKKLLSKPQSRAALSKTPDSFLLSLLAKQIFRAGFVWKIVEHKWPGTEEAFAGFEPEVVAGLADHDLDDLANDPRIVRHRSKIESIRDNARWMVRVAAKHGSFAKFLAEWPENDVVGLWQELHASGSRLGGMTGPFFLRQIGKDTFLLSPDVIKALRREKVLRGKGTSKRDLRAIQEAFNAWRRESGRPFCQLSRILAYSVG